MRFSIITVSYNSASTIADTLRSVAEQSHLGIEHLVIDGASKDATLQIVRTHGAHVARVISEPDNGIYDAMNKGLALATGDYVGFLNADDLFATSQAVAQLAQAATSGADAVFGDLVYVAAREVNRVIRRWHSGEFQPSRLRFGWMPPHPTFYVKRSLLPELGGFDTSLRQAAQHEVIVRRDAQ